MESLWVAVLHISSRVLRKIVEKHRIDPDELRDEIECVAGLPYVWDDDAERGRRAIVQIVLRGRRVLVVLYPDRREEDVYHVGSAYRRRT